MKFHSVGLLVGSVLVLTITVPDSFSQNQTAKINGPTSKLYVAESKGETVLRNGDNIFTLRQAVAFDAPGSVIETKTNSHSALVFSSGTGMFMGENTRLEIKRFTQEPFHPDHNDQLDAPFEPSISQSDVFISRGAVGICTSQMVTGSTMLYTARHASINIRGGKVSIESNSAETIIDLLEGDLTIRHSGNDAGGQLLRPGERAIIRPAPTVDSQPLLTIQQTPRSALKGAEDRVAMACNARKSVTFEIIEELAAAGFDQFAAGQNQEIVPKPTVPQYPPTNIVVSPDRLPGT